MTRKEILLLIPYFTMLIGSVGLLGIAMQVAFHTDPLSSYVFDAVFWGLGFLAIMKRKAVNTYISSSIGKENAVHLSTVYNLLAAVVFMSPFALFAYETLYGVVDLAILSLSVLSLFYLLKFIDYQTIVGPRTVEANLYSILFISFSAIQLIALPFAYGAIREDLKNFVSTACSALVIFLHGAWILSMFKAAPKDLAAAHPRLYYDDMPYRGTYNIIAALFLMGGASLNLALSAKSSWMSVLDVAMIIVISLFASPYLSAFAKQRKIMIRIMTDHKHRKEATRIKKDQWEDEVISRSLIARFLNTVVWSILMLSTIVGASLMYYSVYTGTYFYLIPALVLLSMVLTTFHYRVSARGERIKELFRMFRRRKLLPSEIRRFVEHALAFYAISSGLLLGSTIPIRSTSLERSILKIGAFDVTNIQLLIIFFVFSLLIIFNLCLYLYRRPTSTDVEKMNRQALQALFWLTGLTLIVSINVMFYAFFAPLSAAIFSSLAVLVLLFLFLRVVRNL